MKNLIGFIVLLLIAVAAYVLLSDEEILKPNTEDYKDFAIEDTAAVDRVFMSQPNGKQILISRRENGVWTVNNSFPARTDAIQLILKTLHDIKVKGSVAQETFDHTIKRLATGATKVEFYTGGPKPEKTWYIGDVTPNRVGSYMLLEKDGKKSSQPYITHMLMERGFLGTRFFLDPLLWKDRVILKSDPKEIKSVRVEHFYDTATSFVIEQVELGKFSITNLKTMETEALGDELAVPYFKEFSTVYYEYIDKKTSAEELDSIYSVLPRHKIEVIMNDGSKNLIKTYNMPVLPGSKLAGKVINYHPERMYADTSHLGKSVHPIVPNLTFDKIVPRWEDFKSSTTVEK